MAKKQLGKLQFAHAGTTPAEEFRLPGQDGKLVGAGGELNASNKKDLLNQITAYMQQAQSGNRMVTAADYARAKQVAAAHREAVQAAFEDREQYEALGAEIANELYISANKEGFARRFLKRQELVYGQVPMVQMRMKNVVAVVASAPTRVETQWIRDNWYFPPEFYINARPFIEQRDIQRSNTDVLEQKYIESLEAIMVGEDRTWRNLNLESVGVYNPGTAIVGTMTVSSLATVRNLVTRWRIPATSCLVASDLWIDIVGDTGFQQVIDPVSKHELLLTGYLGSILGMSMVTDAFRHPSQAVLSQGEFWVIGAPENHGQYTDRGGIESQPIDGTVEKIPGRGWWMTETVSMVVANARSVAQGIRS